ncbi:unnamed protein product [Mytilus edulis]|uniref:DZIP3-like HEPN domain-containing protein n=1 Tax=Mytilus edulis TaxID=6550 RepID=A0A8S3VFK0_MYTED|nr:unnamed protein product [Mytilus edulis]
MNVKSKPLNKAIKSGYVSKFKLQWKDIDNETYHNHISNELSQHNIENHSIEESMNFLCNCLKKAATAAVPSKIIKLKGPHFKASPTTLMLLKTSKEKYQLWKSHGKKNDHLKTDKILAQRNLRKQLRKEQYMDRTQFYNELMDNPSNDMFHKLIRRNRGSKNKDAICIIENGEHHYSAKDQTNSFSRYFEDLAVPKDNGYDPEFLDLCNIRHNIFDELCKQNSDEPQFSSQNICDAIKQLHSGKATDELGLAAEHFKNSPTTVTHFLTNCFNNIFINHHIPDIFKSGVPDSKTFDVTLMICLIRNLTSINPPINGFDSLPLPGETTPGSDLARIKFYRNKLAHHDSNTIDTAYFNTAWRDISNAVGRLGGQTMYQECQGLKVKYLDQSNQEIMLEIKQSLEEMKELKLTIHNLDMEHSKVMEILKDPIRENIKGTLHLLIYTGKSRISCDKINIL